MSADKWGKVSPISPTLIQSPAIKILWKEFKAPLVTLLLSAHVSVAGLPKTKHFPSVCRVE